jgi:hypothetical protein
MEQRHDAADHVLCVVSDEYLKAPYSTLERKAALWQAASKRPGFVLFIAVKPCRFPTLIDHFRRCELYSAVSEAERRARLREFMTGKDPPDRIVLPLYAVSNIPIRVPEHFLGRDDALATIETALARYEGRVAITALHGLRGVGKTTLAAVYADRHRGDYRAIWWLDVAEKLGRRALEQRDLPAGTQLTEQNEAAGSSRLTVRPPLTEGLLRALPGDGRPGL